MRYDVVKVAFILCPILDHSPIISAEAGLLAERYGPAVWVAFFAARKVIPNQVG
jgi:hypothetical protein